MNTTLTLGSINSANSATNVRTFQLVLMQQQLKVQSLSLTIWHWTSTANAEGSKCCHSSVITYKYHRRCPQVCQLQDNSDRTIMEANKTLTDSHRQHSNSTKASLENNVHQRGMHWTVKRYCNSAYNCSQWVNSKVTVGNFSEVEV